MGAIFDFWLAENKWKMTAILQMSIHTVISLSVPIVTGIINRVFCLAIPYSDGQIGILICTDNIK